MLCAFYLQRPRTPRPLADTTIDAARLLAGVQYTRIGVGYGRGGEGSGGSVVAALPQRYFENCILRFFRGFACFDRVAADFDLMTFQHTHTHRHTYTPTHTRAITHTHTRRHLHTESETLSTPTSVESQSNNKHHSLTHSLIRSPSQCVTPPSGHPPLLLSPIANERHPSPRITHQLITSQATKSSRAEVKLPHTQRHQSRRHSPRTRRAYSPQTCVANRVSNNNNK